MLNLPNWLLSPWRTFRRRRLLARPFPDHWSPFLAQLPFYRQLPPACQERLRRDLRVVVDEWRWEGCGGLVVDDEMRVVIAATACLLLLGLDHDFYANVSTVLVYPSGWRRPGSLGADGNEVPDGHVLGEAWREGPVVLAWDAARHGSFDPKDGHNLVLHEFAHKLDMIDGRADGRPPLRTRADAAPWREAMQREFDALSKAADRVLLRTRGGARGAPSVALRRAAALLRPGSGAAGRQLTRGSSPAGFQPSFGIAAATSARSSIAAVAAANGSSSM
jgi:Mlc titration factor MtfA (ptsG expression regulator)